MLDGLMGLREHITGSCAHCAADGSTAPDATTGERGDGGAAGRANSAAAEGSLLGFIHARTAGEPEAQDQDCGKRTPAAAHVLNLHPTSFAPALRAQLWIVPLTTGGYSIYSRHSGPLAVPSNELRALRCRRRDLVADKPGIAVLPFEGLGEDAATARLAMGVTEDIITNLARFRGLDVTARNS